jgi:ADP-ribose pyrophosphatase YjhB (NUDIX family)
MTADNRHSVSVAGVVVDDQGERCSSSAATTATGSHPGGILEHDETIEDGLRREVLEETGLEIEPGPLTGVYQNIPRRIIALVFRCHCSESRPLQAPAAQATPFTEQAARVAHASCRRTHAERTSAPVLM